MSWLKKILGVSSKPKPKPMPPPSDNESPWPIEKGKCRLCGNDAPGGLTICCECYDSERGMHCLYNEKTGSSIGGEKPEGEIARDVGMVFESTPVTDENVYKEMMDAIRDTLGRKRIGNKVQWLTTDQYIRGSKPRHINYCEPDGEGVVADADPMDDVTPAVQAMREKLAAERWDNGVVTRGLPPGVTYDPMMRRYVVTAIGGSQSFIDEKIVWENLPRGNTPEQFVEELERQIEIARHIGKPLAERAIDDMVSSTLADLQRRTRNEIAGILPFPENEKKTEE